MAHCLHGPAGKRLQSPVTCHIQPNPSQTDPDAQEPKRYGVQPIQTPKSPNGTAYSRKNFQFQRLNSLDKSLEGPGSNPKSPGPIFLAKIFLKPQKAF